MSSEFQADLKPGIPPYPMTFTNFLMHTSQSICWPDSMSPLQTVCVCMCVCLRNIEGVLERARNKERETGSTVRVSLNGSLRDFTSFRFIPIWEYWYWMKSHLQNEENERSWLDITQTRLWLTYDVSWTRLDFKEIDLLLNETWYLPGLVLTDFRLDFSMTWNLIQTQTWLELV